MVAKLGHGLYRLALPAIRRLLQGSSRVRILITVDNEILLVKNLISRQLWMLPGGGIQDGETPRQAAVRELQEELGLSLPPEKFSTLDEFDFTDEHRISWRAVLMQVRLDRKPLLRTRRLELIDADWHKDNELPRGRDPLVDKALGQAKD